MGARIGWYTKDVRFHTGAILAERRAHLGIHFHFVAEDQKQFCKKRKKHDSDGELAVVVHACN